MYHTKALDELNCDLEELEEYVDVTFRKVNRRYTNARHEHEGLRNYHHPEQIKFTDGSR